MMHQWISAVLQLSSPTVMLYCLIGCLIGTMIGLMPGIGPIAVISILLPFTYHLPLSESIVMLAGIYYGSQYSDNVSAIIMKVAHPTSVIMTLDGHDMHRNGETGLALFSAGFSSFVGGWISFFTVIFLSVPLARLALYFGPADYCLLIVLGLIITNIGSKNNLLDGMAMTVVGMLLSMVGTDSATGVLRFSMHLSVISDNINIVAITTGIFVLPEIIENYQNKRELIKIEQFKLIPNFTDFKTICISSLRGGFLGSIVGILPGGGAMLAQYLSYSLEKKLCKNPRQSMIGGIAGPGSADEAATRTSFIPLLSFGIPENPVTALILGAMILHGIVPGPSFINNNPRLFWEFTFSLLLGNIFLVLINVPMVHHLLKFFKVKYTTLIPYIIFFAIIGVYSVKNDFNDVLVMLFFGAIGYVFRLVKLPVTPMILGFILAPYLEDNFKRFMLINHGDATVLFDDKIAIVLTVIILISLLSLIRKKL